METTITLNIDGTICTAKPEQTILQAALDNGIYIPHLCHYEGLKPAGACRLCSVKAAGRYMAACHTPVNDGMIIENMTPELEDMRKAIIEMLFVEGSHLCPSCEKSGNCELQAMGYRYRMLVPRFPYLWPEKKIDASSSKIIHDAGRCIECKRCVRGVATKSGFSFFNLINRGPETRIKVDATTISEISDKQAERAMNICPVGAILRKEVGFAQPVGTRKYDTAPIGDGDSILNK